MAHEEKMMLLVVRGLVAGLSEEQQSTIKQIKAEFAEVVENNKDNHDLCMIAMSLFAAEIAVETT